MGEAGLGLRRADLGLAVPTPLAPAAALDEGGGDSIADAEPGHVRAEFEHHPGELVAGHVRQRDRVVAAPGVPVRPAHPGGADTDDDAVGRALGVGQVDDPQGTGDLVVGYRSHSREL